MGVADSLARAEVSMALTTCAQHMLDLAAEVPNAKDPKSVVEKMNQTEETMRHLRRRTSQLLVLGPDL